MKTRIIVALIVMLLSACSVTPVPSEYHFRLQTPEPVSAPARDAYLGAITAADLFASRSVVWSDASGQQLQTYYYQFWSQAPHRMLADYFAASLAPFLTGDIHSQQVKLHITRFERVVDGDARAARVALAVNIAAYGKQPNRRLGVVEATVTAQDQSMKAFVNAMDVAMRDVSDQLVALLTESLPAQ